MAPDDDPAAATSRAEFGALLTVLRERAGLTVRDVGDRTGISLGTLSGYFAGTALPRAQSRNLEAVLAACGVHGFDQRRRWHDAVIRIRRLERARRHNAGGTDAATVGEPVGFQPSVGHDDAAGTAADIDDAVSRRRPASVGVTGDFSVSGPSLVSTRAPVERLAQNSQIRGRRDLLDLLTGAVFHQSGVPGPRVHVLHGLAGSGKSTVAIALARIAAGRGMRPWWINGVAATNVAAGMQAIAAELGAGREQLRLGNLPDIVWRLLDAYRRPWLLVIDDVDDPSGTLSIGGGRLSDGTGWVRPIGSRFGTVVITTRDGSPTTWGRPAGWMRLHKVGSLSERDAGRVLFDLVGPGAGSLDGAVILARRLGGLPLALRMAGGFLAEAVRMPPGFAGSEVARTYQAYAEAFDSRTDADGPVPPGGFPGPHELSGLISRSWDLSLDSLAARGWSAASALLRTLSCLSAAPIPYALVLRPEILNSSPLFPQLTARSLWDTLNALADIGLITLYTDAAAHPATADLASIHPLVREISRAHPGTQAALPAYTELIAHLLDAATQALDSRLPEHWPQWAALAPHCAAPLTHADAQHPARPERLRTAVRAVTYLRASGHLAAARVAGEELVANARTLFGAEAAATLDADHELQRIKYGLGLYVEAEAGFRSVLAARVALLGADHPDTLTTRHYLARLLRSTDRAEQARALLATTLETRRAVLGEHHPDTLTSKNNLADLLRAEGRPQEAEKLIADVLSARTALLGARHPATLVAAYHAARIAHDLGRVEDGAEQLRDLAGTSRLVLGDDHPRTLLVEHHLGVMLLELGRHAEAEALLATTVDKRVHVLGADHADTAATREALRAARDSTLKHPSGEAP